MFVISKTLGNYNLSLKPLASGGSGPCGSGGCNVIINEQRLQRNTVDNEVALSFTIS